MNLNYWSIDVVYVIFAVHSHQETKIHYCLYVIAVKAACLEYKRFGIVYLHEPVENFSMVVFNFINAAQLPFNEFLLSVCESFHCAFRFAQRSGFLKGY